MKNGGVIYTGYFIYSENRYIEVSLLLAKVPDNQHFSCKKFAQFKKKQYLCTRNKKKQPANPRGYQTAKSI